MRFKVIVCTKCGRARGARADSKRVTCIKCGAILKVEEAKAYLTTDSESELAVGVAEVNARLQLRKGGDKKDIPHPSTVKAELCIRKAKRTYEQLIEDLGKRTGTFSFDDILALFAKEQGVVRSDIDEKEILNIIDRLKTKGFLVEPRDRLYRLI